MIFQIKAMQLLNSRAAAFKPTEYVDNKHLQLALNWSPSENEENSVRDAMQLRYV